MSDRPGDFETIIRFEYDVFTIFATEDEDLARQIVDGLEQIHLRCNAQFKQNAFQTGQNVFDNILYNVKNAHRTLLLLTEKSLKSQWVTLETILALEESQRCNSLRLRMLLYGVSDKDIKFLKRGILASVPPILIDFNSREWNVHLAAEIRREIPIPAILPVGSMAHGLVFSHYTGFLCHVLPVLKQEIEKSKIFREKPLHVSKKYYMLLPGTCNIYDDLSSEDEEMQIKIEKEEVLEFVRSHAGKDRTFKLTIYKISQGQEEYYFFADFPHVLKAMFRMENEMLAEVDIRFQIARFFFTMNEMINHAENEDCHNTVQLLLFNENVESMQTVLWYAVSNSVPAEVQETMVSELQGLQIGPLIQQPLLRLDSESNNLGIDATISCCNDCLADRNIAADIQKFLEERGKKVESNTRGHFQLPPAHWRIFVLSKDALTDSLSLTTQCMGALADDLWNHSIRVLVVIRDLDPRHVPRFIKCVNMLKVSEPNYCDKLLKTMNGDALRLEHSLPAGDVATGLAWAYVINYLTITLLGKSSEETGCLDFRGRIQKFLRDKKVVCGCIMKMFIVLPKSCTTSPQLADKANERPDDSQVHHGVGKVTKLGSLEKVVMNTGGQLERPFYLQMYQHQDPVSQRSICFIAEYCTPSNCMRQMVDTYKFAGLHEEEMERQGEMFVHTLSDIMQREAVKQGLGEIGSLVQVIYYDDKTETLLSAIERHVQTGGQEIVYAEDHPRTGDPYLMLP